MVTPLIGVGLFSFYGVMMLWMEIEKKGGQIFKMLIKGGCEIIYADPSEPIKKLEGVKFFQINLKQKVIYRFLTMASKTLLL
jgi:hypothetical protein